MYFFIIGPSFILKNKYIFNEFNIFNDVWPKKSHRVCHLAKQIADNIFEGKS